MERYEFTVPCIEASNCVSSMRQSRAVDAEAVLEDPSCSTIVPIRGHYGAGAVHGCTARRSIPYRPPLPLPTIHPLLLFLPFPYTHLVPHSGIVFFYERRLVEEGRIPSEESQTYAAILDASRGDRSS